LPVFHKLVVVKGTHSAMSISLILIAAIFLISLVLTMVGLGGGLVFSPLFVILGLAKPQAASASLFLNLVAAASSTFIVCFSSLTGFLGYAAMASVDWRFILPAALAALAGGQLGARIMSGHVKARSIRVIFSLVLFAMRAKLIHRFLFG
jgi:hypothetical protein